MKRPKQRNDYELFCAVMELLSVVMMFLVKITFCFFAIIAAFFHEEFKLPKDKHY